MLKRSLLLVLAVLLLEGCATQITLPALTADHPASPQAAEAPTPEASTTLHSDPPFKGSEAEVGSMPSMGHDHGDQDLRDE